MSIVSLESADEKNVSASILNFLTAYGVISLLSKCGGTKLKGIVSLKLTYHRQSANIVRCRPNRRSDLLAGILEEILR